MERELAEDLPYLDALVKAQFEGMGIMAKVNAPDNTDPAGVQWETMTLGLGEAWDFERNGALIGNFLGSTTQEVTDKQTGEKRTTNVYQFAPYDNPEETVFVWGSYAIDSAFSDDRIRQGDLVKITYLGMEQFTDPKTKQPRVAKRYKIQAAKNAPGTSNPTS